MADETSTPTPTTETVAPTEQPTPNTEAPSTTLAETAPTEKKQEEIDFSRFNAALKDGEKKELLPDDEENSVKEVLKPAKFNLDEQREFTIAPGNMMPASKLVYPHILNFDVLHPKAEVVLLCKKPKIYAFEFLKDEEAEELKALATPERLLPGKVGYGTNGGAVVRNFRHALDACIPVNAVPEWFYKRVEDLIGFPRTHFENVHICKYTEGGHFTPHVDYSQTNDWEGLKPFGGQRVATFLCYLNALQPGQGGETEFPFAGIKMRPVKDVCLYTFNFTSDGRADPLTFHAALPVVGAETEKWIALLGIREHAYDDKTFDDVVPTAEGTSTATETADPATEVSTPKQEEAPKAEEPKVEA